MHTQSIERGAQHVLVLVERGGLKTFPHSGPHSKRDYMPAAVSGVCIEAFVKDQDQDAILLEPGIVEQRTNIVLEPCVRRCEFDRVGATRRRCGAVMRVVVLVGHDE